VEGAGSHTRQLQKALTKEREELRFQQLDVCLRALPPGDMRRMAWVNLDKFSTAWVAAWPDRDAYLTNAEFSEVATFYYGLPSPGCAALVGERIASSRSVLDEYGCALTTETLPGDGWRTQHDAVKWRLSADMREMQARATTEVYGLFAAHIPQRGRARLGRETCHKRQGLVPDFMVYADWGGPERACLLELKTLHFGRSTYGNESRRCEAVARRARALPGEYATKARIIDSRYCDTPDGEQGPVSRHLQSFDPVRSLVFGAWGEASAHVEHLLDGWLVKAPLTIGGHSAAPMKPQLWVHWHGCCDVGGHLRRSARMPGSSWTAWRSWDVEQLLRWIAVCEQAPSKLHGLPLQWGTLARASGGEVLTASRHVWNWD
jgi:hypothetical protein